jgi:cytochrome P450
MPDWDRSRGLDLLDPRFRADPYPFYRELRESDPVHASVSGAWVLLRHADVRAALNDARFAHWGESLEQAPLPFLRSLGRWLRLMDPRAKSRLRAHAAPLFSADAVGQLRAEISSHVENVMPAPGMPIDVVAQLAEPLTMRVAATLLGIPPELQREAEPVLRAALDRFATLVQGQSAWNASDPLVSEIQQWVPAEKPSLLSAMRHAVADGESIAREEAAAFALIFLFAAQENIKSFLACAILALARDRDAWDAVGRATTAEWLDELFRFDPPLQFVSLVAREDVEFGDRLLRAGSQVLASLGAANRDPSVFAEPDRLVLDRTPNPHVTFGSGALYCIGAAYARLQAEIALGRLAQRFAPPEIDESAVRWKPFSLVQRGPSALHARFISR